MRTWEAPVDPAWAGGECWHRSEPRESGGGSYGSGSLPRVRPLIGFGAVIRGRRRRRGARRP